MTHRAKTFCGAIAILMLLAQRASALEQDRQQPLQIHAASISANNKTGVAVYSGQVVIVQGSLRINAERVEVRAAATNRRMQIITATGKPARLRMLAKLDEDEIIAYALHIVYDADKREVDLTGNVRVQQSGDEFQAARAHYSLGNSLLTAEAQDDGRVSATLQPRSAKPANPTP